MTNKDFWRSSTVAVIGAGSWGTLLASLAAKNCREVRIMTWNEEQARQINATKTNGRYLPEFQLDPNIHAVCEWERVFADGVQALIWALPSGAYRQRAKEASRFFCGEELNFHASKGVEEGSLKRISEILREELPCARIGVISGPNLAQEVARGDPSATVVASRFGEVTDAGVALLSSEKFRVYTSSDVIGVEWAGVLKNVLALAAGGLDALKFGWNAKAMLISRGLVEMVRFGLHMGAKQPTFLGLAGLGDLLATAGSPLSRNYRVGMGLAKGERLEKILADLEGVAEGVKTTRAVHAYAKAAGILMPITDGVYQLLEEKMQVTDVLRHLMIRPSRHEWEAF